MFNPRFAALLLAAVCLMAALTGCTAPDSPQPTAPGRMVFATGFGVYEALPDAEPILLHRWAGTDFQDCRFFQVLGDTVYLLDGDTVYRAGAGEPVTQLMTASGATYSNIGSAHRRSVFSVVEEGGETTVFYLDQKIALTPTAGFGQTNHSIRAQSTDGSVRYYPVPIDAGSGFHVENGGIYTMRCAAGDAPQKTTSFGLYRTELRSGKTRCLQEDSWMMARGSLCGTTALLLVDDIRKPGEGGSMVHFEVYAEDGGACSFDIETSLAGYQCSNGLMAVWRTERVDLHRLETGELLLSIPRGGDEWESYFHSSGLFFLSATERRAVVSIPAKGLQQYYAYLVDLETMQLADRWYLE